METKIVVNIELKGSTRVKRETPDVIKWELTKKDIDSKYKGNDKNKVVKKGKRIHYNYDVKPATLHTNICLDAYKYWVSDECPSFSNKKVWNRLSSKERIEAHLQHLCDHHRGISYTYEILRD